MKNSWVFSDDFLGALIYLQTENEHYHERGRQTIEKLANDGYAPAQLKYGSMLKGEKAMQYLQLAVNQNYLPALYVQGKLLLVTNKDPQKAISVLSRAAKMKCMSSLNLLVMCLYEGYAVEKNEMRAIQLWTDIAAKAPLPKDRQFALDSLNRIARNESPKEGITT